MFFQTLNLDVSIQSKGKLGILLKKRVNEGYVVCNVKNYSPLFGTLEKGDLITHWDNRHLGSVNTFDLARIVEASQTDGFFRLRVKREAKSASGGSAIVQGKANASDTTARDSGACQSEKQIEAIKRKTDADKQSVSNRLVGETIGIFESTRVEKGVHELTESEKKKRSLGSNTATQSIDSSETQKDALNPVNRNECLIRETRHPSIPKDLSSEMKTTTVTESMNKQRALESLNAKNEEQVPNNAFAGDMETTTVTESTKKQRALESDIPSNEEQVPNNSSAGEMEPTRATEPTNKQRSLESDVAAEPPNRDKTFIPSNEEQVPNNAFAGEMEPTRATEPTNKQRALESDIPSNEEQVPNNAFTGEMESTRATESTNKRQALESDIAPEDVNKDKTLMARDEKQAPNRAFMGEMEPTRATESTNKLQALETDIVAESPNISEASMIRNEEQVQNNAFAGDMETSTVTESTHKLQTLEFEIAAEPPNIGEALMARNEEIVQNNAFVGEMETSKAPVSTNRKRSLESDIVPEIVNRGEASMARIEKQVPNSAFASDMEASTVTESTNRKRSLKSDIVPEIVNRGETSMARNEEQVPNNAFASDMETSTVTESTKKRQALESDIAAEPPNKDEAFIARDEKQAPNRAFVGEMETSRATVLTNKRQALESDIAAEIVNRGETSVARNEKKGPKDAVNKVTSNVRLGETRSPCRTNTFTGEMESVKPKESSSRKRACEPLNRGETPSANNNGPFLKDAVNAVNKYEFHFKTRYPSIPKDFAADMETTTTTESTHRKLGLESNISTKQINRREALLVDNEEQMAKEAFNTVLSKDYFGKIRSPSISKSVQGAMETSKGTESTNRKRALESDTAVKYPNQDKALMARNGEQMPTDAANAANSSEILGETGSPCIPSSFPGEIKFAKATESTNKKQVLESDFATKHLNQREAIISSNNVQVPKVAVNTINYHGCHHEISDISKSKQNNRREPAFQKDAHAKDGNSNSYENDFANAKISPGQKLGIFLRRNKSTSNISVESVLKTSPFYRKLEAGDIITYFNEVNLKNKSIHEVKELFESYPGCRLRIGFQRLKKNLQEENLHLNELQSQHESKIVCIPNGDFILGLKMQKISCGMLVLSLSESSHLRGMLDKGDVITHLNSKSIKNDTSHEFRHKFIHSQECRLSVTRAKNFKSSSAGELNRSNIFEINRRASDTKVEARKTDSRKSNDRLKSSFSVCAVDATELTDVEITSLPCWYAFIVDDERSAQKAQKRNERLLMHRKINTKVSAVATSQKPSSRVKKIPIHIGSSAEFKGWTEEIHEKSGSNQRYKYWFSPIKKYKFRTKKGIELFLTALKKTGGDEDKAYFLIKDELK
jgi:hypothetical protein